MKTSRTAIALTLLLGCGTAPATSPVPQTPAPAATPVTSPAAAAAKATSAASAAAPDKPPAPVTFPPGWEYAADAPTITGQHGMVVTDAGLATRVGVEMLKAGGNAVDAAIAVAFALAVVYPGAGNIGGGGFMVARIDGAAHALDFRETAPSTATHDTFADKGKGADKAVDKAKDAGKRRGTPAQVGHLASGVPGSVAGLWEAYQKLGSKKKTWAELIAPAIKLAEEGFVVDAEFARSAGDNTERLSKYPASVALFLKGGAPPKEGSTWKNPELGAALRRISDKGLAGFYDGKTADLLVAEMKRGGGLITKADLTAYKAKWRTPITFSYRGRQIVSMPPPSSGGVTLAMISQILEGYDLTTQTFHSPEELHLIFEAMRRAFIARNAKLGDPDFVKNPLDELLSPAWATAQRATIKPGRATPTSELTPVAHDSGGSGPHTTHFSVVAERCNAVALTTTINWFYGSGVTVAGAGFLMNNEMDDFATVPGTANGYGLVQGEPNAVAPGKRMLSSMSPSIVTDKDGKTLLVLGGAGGPTIITGVFCELSGVIDHGLSLTAATNAPRFHEQGEPDVVMIEKGGLTDAQRAGLAEMGYTFKERGHIADAPSIGFANGVWVGAAEPRRLGGLALGY